MPDNILLCSYNMTGSITSHGSTTGRKQTRSRDPRTLAKVEDKSPPNKPHSPRRVFLIHNHRRTKRERVKENARIHIAKVFAPRVYDWIGIIPRRRYTSRIGRMRPLNSMREIRPPVGKIERNSIRTKRPN